MYIQIRNMDSAVRMYLFMCAYISNKYNQMNEAFNLRVSETQEGVERGARRKKKEEKPM